MKTGEWGIVGLNNIDRLGEEVKTVHSTVAPLFPPSAGRVRVAKSQAGVHL
jgi:hypothetical protein